MRASVFASGADAILCLTSGVLAGASEQFGYPTGQISLGLFVGKFKPSDESAVRDHVAGLSFGGGPVRLFDLRTIMTGVVESAGRKTYRDDPIVVTLKCLQELGWLAPDRQG